MRLKFAFVVVLSLCGGVSRAADVSLEQKLPGTVWTFPAAKADEDKAKIQFLKYGQLKLGWNPAAPASTFHWKIIAPDTVELRTEIDPRKSSLLKIDADFLEGTLTADGKAFLADNVTTPAGANLIALLTRQKVAKLGEGWDLKDGAITGPARKPSLFLLPDEQSLNDYVLRIRLQPIVRRRGLDVCFPVGDREAVISLDAQSKTDIESGLSVSAKAVENPAPVVSGRLFADGVTRKLEIGVSCAGDNAVIVASLDGKPMLQWAGETKLLRAATVGHDPVPTKKIGFISWENDWAISSVRVSPSDAAAVASMKASAENATGVVAPVAQKVDKIAAPVFPSWVTHELPKPGPSGWITLFDGKTLRGIDEHFILTSRPDQAELKDDGLHLKDTQLHFALKARDVVLRVRAVGEQWDLETRTTTEPPPARHHGYRASTAHHHESGSIAVWDDDKDIRKELKPWKRDGTPELASYEFSALGNRLTLRVEGNSVADVKDDSIAEGAVAVGVRAPIVVKRIEVKILDDKK
jgi:hypothetical protein